jgi:hypothetical protein
MVIDVGNTPEMTLRVVRQTFGHETVNGLDPGMDQHGNSYKPIYKGSVHYWNVRKASLEGRVETAFYFRLDPSTKHKTEAPGEIVDDDVVTRIEMQDSQRLRLENR